MAIQEKAVRWPKPPTEKSQTVVGKCPRCQREVIVHEYEYMCLGNFSGERSNGIYFRECYFTMYRYPLKTLGKPEITPDEMQVLLQGKAIWLENLRKKDGALFSCYGLLDLMRQPVGIRFVSSGKSRLTMAGSPLRRVKGIKQPEAEGEGMTG